MTGDDNGVRVVIGPTAAAREAIRHLPDGFTMPMIAEWVEKRHPLAKIKRAHFSSALNKLTQMKEIVQVQAPTGRDPAVYNKARMAQTSSAVNGNGQ